MNRFLVAAVCLLIGCNSQPLDDSAPSHADTAKPNASSTISTTSIAELEKNLEAAKSQIAQLKCVHECTFTILHDSWRLEFIVFNSASGDSLLNAFSHYTSQIRDQDGAWGSEWLKGRMYFDSKETKYVSAYVVSDSLEVDPVHFVETVIQRFEIYEEDRLQIGR